MGFDAAALVGGLDAWREQCGEAAEIPLPAAANPAEIPR